MEHEVKTARKIERETKRDVLCPVSLDDAWKDKITDVDWEHLTKKNILDFSKWKTKAFGGQFEKLLKGLKIYYEKPKEGGTAERAAVMRGDGVAPGAEHVTGLFA